MLQDIEIFLNTSDPVLFQAQPTTVQSCMSLVCPFDFFNLIVLTTNVLQEIEISNPTATSSKRKEPPVNISDTVPAVAVPHIKKQRMSDEVSLFESDLRISPIQMCLGNPDSKPCKYSETSTSSAFFFQPECPLGAVCSNSSRSSCKSIFSWSREFTANLQLNKIWTTAAKRRNMFALPQSYGSCKDRIAGEPQERVLL